MRATFNQLLGLVIAAIVLAVIGGCASITLWMLNTLFRLELPSTLATITAAALLNLMLAWTGAAPWLLLSLKGKSDA